MTQFILQVAPLPGQDGTVILYSSKTLSRALSISETEARRRISAREFGVPVRMGRKVLVRRADVEEWIARGGNKRPAEVA